MLRIDEAISYKGHVDFLGGVDGVSSEYSGKTFYCDPKDGLPTNSGLDREHPRLEVQSVHDDLVVHGRGDVVKLIGFEETGHDFIENLVVTKGFGLIAGHPIGNARLPTVAPAAGIALDVRPGAFGFWLRDVRGAGVGVGGYGMKLACDGVQLVRPDLTADTEAGLVLVGQASGEGKTGSGLRLIGGQVAECGGNGIRQGGATGKDIFATNVHILGTLFFGNGDADIEDENEVGKTYFYQWIVSGMFMDRNKAEYLAMKGGLATQSAVVNSFFNDSGLNNTKIKIPAAGCGWINNYDSTGLVAQSAIT